MLYLVSSLLGRAWFLLQEFGEPAFPNEPFCSKTAGNHAVVTLGLAIS